MIQHLTVLLICLLCGCNSSEQNKRVDIQVPQHEDGNFILYVSNQSLAIDPVDILIQINGENAISSKFEVQNQHNWIKHSFKLTQGTHTISASSQKGQAMLETSFELTAEKHWAVIDYWHSPKQDGKKHFSFTIKDQQIYFE